MKVLIFDTETTGLPKQRVGAHAGPNNWPHIVSIAWCIYDSEKHKVTNRKSFIIKPVSWIIPEESTAIHGVIQSYAERYGSDFERVIKEFLETEYDILVAHNLAFDENVMLNAIWWDLGQRDFPGFTKPKYCTMLLSRDMCKLPYPSGYPGNKPPKLSELYEHVFRKKPIKNRLHGAHYDTKLLADILSAHDPLRVAIGLHPIHVNKTHNDGNPQTESMPSSTLVL